MVSSRRYAHKKKREVTDGFTKSISRTTCNKCGKRCYFSRNEAKRAVRILYPGRVMHVYQCTSSEHYTTWWHITSISSADVTAIKDLKIKHSEEDKSRHHLYFKSDTDFSRYAHLAALLRMPSRLSWNAPGEAPSCSVHDMPTLCNHALRLSRALLRLHYHDHAS